MTELEKIIGLSNGKNAIEYRTIYGTERNRMQMEETDETMRFLQKQYNKKWMLPLLTFVVGCLILTAFIHHSYDTNRKQVRMITELNASTYAERLRDDMNRGVAIADALKAIIISGDGTIDNLKGI